MNKIALFDVFLNAPTFYLVILKKYFLILLVKAKKCDYTAMRSFVRVSSLSQLSWPTWMARTLGQVTEVWISHMIKFSTLTYHSFIHSSIHSFVWTLPLKLGITAHENSAEFYFMLQNEQLKSMPKREWVGTNPKALSILEDWRTGKKWNCLFRFWWTEKFGEGIKRLPLRSPCHSPLVLSRHTSCHWSLNPERVCRPALSRTF